MNNLRNHVQLMGYLGTDPEVKTFESGKKKTSFRLATNERFKNTEGEMVDDTQWHNISAWGKLGEIMSLHLKKGTEVIISGKISYSNYKDSTGNVKYVTEIKSDSMEIITKKSAKSAN